MVIQENAGSGREGPGRCAFLVDCTGNCMSVLPKVEEVWMDLRRRHAKLCGSRDTEALAQRLGSPMPSE